MWKSLLFLMHVLLLSHIQNPLVHKDLGYWSFLWHTNHNMDDHIVYIVINRRFASPERVQNSKPTYGSKAYNSWYRNSWIREPSAHLFQLDWWVKPFCEIPWQCPHWTSNHLLYEIHSCILKCPVLIKAFPVMRCHCNPNLRKISYAAILIFPDT